MTAMLALVESAGFELGHAALNMSAPTTFRIATPDGVGVQRALGDDDANGAIALVRAHWPSWEAELSRGLEMGSCFVARVDGGDAVAAFACHSVNRAGWVGPIGTDPTHQRRGIAAALMSDVCRDLAAAGHAGRGDRVGGADRLLREGRWARPCRAPSSPDGAASVDVVGDHEHDVVGGEHAIALGVELVVVEVVHETDEQRVVPLLDREERVVHGAACEVAGHGEAVELLALGVRDEIGHEP